MKKAKIISAFPGCGKTTSYLLLKNNVKVVDSDSSLFDKSDFPKNYIKNIKDIMYDYDVIFVSSHESVRNELINENIDFVIYYPSKNRKNEFLENYKNRGNDKSFIQFLSNNFDRFVDEIKEDERLNKIELINENDFILNDDYFKSLLETQKNDTFDNFKEAYKLHPDLFKDDLGDRNIDDLTESDFDFQGWLIPHSNIRDILKVLGFKLNDKTNEWSINDSNPILNAYPTVLQDDGMGYGAISGKLTSVFVDSNNDVKIWF